MAHITTWYNIVDVIIPLTFVSPLGGLRRNIAIKFGVENLEWRDCPAVKKYDDMFIRFDRMPASGMVEFNVPLDTLYYVISETILRVR